MCVCVVVGGSRGLSFLPESSNSCWGVEDNFCSIDPIHQPVLWVMTTITNIYANPSCNNKSFQSLAFSPTLKMSQESKANSRVIAIHDWPFLKIELSQWSKYDHFFSYNFSLYGHCKVYILGIKKTDIEWNVFNYLEIQCFWNCIITWSAGWIMVFFFLMFVHGCLHLPNWVWNTLCPVFPSM